MEERFDKLGEDYFNVRGGKVHLYYARRKARILKEYLKPIDRVLDIGCGVGEHARLLKDSCGRVHGLDLSKELVKAANKNLARDFGVRGSVVKLPFRDKIFDVTYSVNLLHHLKSLEVIKEALREMKRITRREIIILDLNPKNPFCKHVLFKICPYDE
jgi:ubiquinone/menaquinone biosynthesis C-methylase UbiE